MLVSSISQESEFWLNVFMPLSRLNEYWLVQDQFVVPFTPLRKMPDSREGWGKESLVYKQVLPIIMDYNERVKADGGIVECDACLIKSMLGFYNLGSKIKLLRYNDLKEVLLTYLDLIKNARIRSFFKTNSIEEAALNRYMWDLYAEVKPCEKLTKILQIPEKKILISFEWRSLAKAIDALEAEIIAGDISYLDDRNRLFYKDASYAHEKEFRIAYLEKGNEKPIFLSIKDVKTVVTIENYDRATEKYFEDLGFSHSSEMKNLRPSNLEVEDANHNDQDIARAIDLLNSIDPIRWDEVMLSNN